MKNNIIYYLCRIGTKDTEERKFISYPDNRGGHYRKLNINVNMSEAAIVINNGMNSFIKRTIKDKKFKWWLKQPYK